MHPAGKLCTVVFLLAIFITVPAAADTVVQQVGPYTVTSGSPPPGSIVDDSGADGTVTFWELPLWIQVSYVSGILAGVLASLFVIIKVVPLLVIKARKRLDSKNKETVFRHIEDNPGCTVNDISRGESLNAGSVRYHVYRLSLEHKIQQVKHGKFVRIFRNNGAYDEREIAVISAMNIRTSRRIILLLREKPGLSNSQIAHRLDIKESMACRYVAHLTNDRILRSEKDDRTKVYYLENDVSGILEKCARTETA